MHEGRNYSLCICIHVNLLFLFSCSYFFISLEVVNCMKHTAIWHVVMNNCIFISLQKRPRTCCSTGPERLWGEFGRWMSRGSAVKQMGVIRVMWHLHIISCCSKDRLWSGWMENWRKPGPLQVQLYFIALGVLKGGVGGWGKSALSLRHVNLCIFQTAAYAVSQGCVTLGGPYSACMSS